MGTEFGQVVSIAPVAVCTSDVDRVGRMHVPDLAVALNARMTLGRSIGLALSVHVDIAKVRRDRVGLIASDPQGSCRSPGILACRRWNARCMELRRSPYTHLLSRLRSEVYWIG